MRQVTVLISVLYSFYMNAQQTSGIEVSAEQRISMQANALVIELQLDAEAGRAEDAQKQIVQWSNELHQMLEKEAFIRDLVDGQMQIHKQYPAQNRNTPAYRAQRVIRFQLIKPEAYPKLSIQLAETGVANFRIAEFVVENREQKEMELQAQAFSKAEAKARNLAKKAGLRLGKAIFISEFGNSSINPRMKAAYSSSSALDHSNFSVELREQISVRFQLLD